MAYLGVLLVAVVNCVAFFFASLLAASGNGGSDGLVTFWRWGYGWIAAFTVVSLFLCLSGKRQLANSVVALTLPIGFLAVYFIRF